MDGGSERTKQNNPEPAEPAEPEPAGKRRAKTSPKAASKNPNKKPRAKAKAGAKAKASKAVKKTVAKPKAKPSSSAYRAPCVATREYKTRMSRKSGAYHRALKQARTDGYTEEESREIARDVTSHAYHFGELSKKLVA